MHYFIDAYNLLFRLRGRDEQLQRQRDHLIHDLAKQAAALDLDVTLVFDSSYPPGEATKGHLGAIEIIYTSQGESADSYILNALSGISLLKQETVVTSDKALAACSRRQGAKVISVENFLLWLEACYRNKRKKHRMQELRPVSKTPNPLPLKPVSPEEHYLQVFEKRFHELEEAQEKPKLEKKRGRKQKPRVVKESPESDMERWLRIFEEGVKD